ncbi:MAG: ribbon-helix-helix protein, CopG family, partial [Senegalimassilia sp.]|nr:ribbon-helix-helix protein, CopG family [Senegalimassilia sp.]
MERSGEAHIGLRVSESMVAEIDKLAAVQGVSRSDCLRKLISEGLLR